MMCASTATCQDCGQTSPEGADGKAANRWAEHHVAPGHSVVTVSTPVHRMVADLTATRRDR
jgi:hypothetical protein